MLIRRMEPAEAPECEAILRALPDWFGIEEAIVQYRRDLERMETYVVPFEGSDVENPAETRDGSVTSSLAGFITLAQHNPFSAEIHILAVRRERHRAGIGRALVRHAERVLCERGIEFLEVKTLGPSRPDASYALTRAFYLAMGFRPLEENRLWGTVNPCLFLIKHLSCSSESTGRS